MTKEMKEVDRDILLILDQNQAGAVRASKNQGKRIIAIEGLPGSGKTLLGLQILKAKIEEAKNKTGADPIVIITKPLGFEDGYPLRQLLEANAPGV